MLTGSAEIKIKDTVEIGDEVTFVIKDHMTEKGWKAVKIVYSTAHSSHS